uniref:Transmembrane protein n=1 Tax=Davidia involucrata TaxID=16924 RepID=A0A5B7BWT8_DAVIN
MEKCRGITTLFLLWVIILSPGIISTVGDGGQNNVEPNQEKPSATEMIRDIYSQLTTSSVSYWDKVKSFINQVQAEFFPPNLDFRSRDEGHSTGGGGNEGARGKMKDAAEKSFGTSKVAVEESAKSAAKAVGEAVHKTAEKVKQSMSERDESDAEL